MLGLEETAGLTERFDWSTAPAKSLEVAAS
jgi:hypothetical protein